MTRLTLCAALTLTATAALADTGATPLTYAQFEAAVPHIDLDACPASLPQDDTFCRATLAHEEIHVFFFSDSGESPMVGFASFTADGMDKLLD